MLLEFLILRPCMWILGWTLGIVISICIYEIYVVKLGFYIYVCVSSQVSPQQAEHKWSSKFDIADAAVSSIIFDVSSYQDKPMLSRAFNILSCYFGVRPFQDGPKHVVKLGNPCKDVREKKTLWVHSGKNYIIFLYTNAVWFFCFCPLVLPEKCHLLQAVATTGRLQQVQKGTKIRWALWIPQELGRSLPDAAEWCCLDWYHWEKQGLNR